MKHLFYALAFLAACGWGSMNASAQKCKFVTDEVDPMTEERVRRTKMTLEGRDFVVNYYRKANEFRVEMAVALVGERNVVMEEGTALTLKLGNGDIETFLAVGRATPVSYVAGTQVATNYTASFACSEAQMSLLAEHGFSVASIELGEETLTRVVKSKKASETMENARCMLGD